MHLITRRPIICPNSISSVKTRDLSEEEEEEEKKKEEEKEEEKEEKEEEKEKEEDKEEEGAKVSVLRVH